MTWNWVSDALVVVAGLAATAAVIAIAVETRRGRRSSQPLVDPPEAECLRLDEEERHELEYTFRAIVTPEEVEP